jgi:hypothetical protein
MLCAIARQWITGGGSASAADEIATVTTQTAAELAAECASAWQLDVAKQGRHQDDETSHMDDEGYDLADLEAAFADVMPAIKAAAEAYIAEQADDDA